MISHMIVLISNNHEIIFLILSLGSGTLPTFKRKFGFWMGTAFIGVLSTFTAISFKDRVCDFNVCGSQSQLLDIVIMSMFLFIFINIIAFSLTFKNFSSLIIVIELSRSYASNIFKKLPRKVTEQPWAEYQLPPTMKPEIFHTRPSTPKLDRRNIPNKTAQSGVPSKISPVPPEPLTPAIRAANQARDASLSAARAVNLGKNNLNPTLSKRH